MANLPEKPEGCNLGMHFLVFAFFLAVLVGTLAAGTFNAGQ